MQMSGETKFGYGFLLVGTAVPYLIDRLFGPRPALGIMILFTLVGLALLYAGHRHRDEHIDRPWDARRIGRMLVGIVLLVGIGWSIWHFADKGMKSESATTKGPQIQNTASAEQIAEAVAKKLPKPTPDKEIVEQHSVRTSVTAKVGHQGNKQPAAKPEIKNFAALEFSLMNDEVKTNPQLLPLTDITLPLEDGVATVHISAKATGEIAAKNVTIIVRICIDCVYAEEPKTFVLADNDAKSPDRRTHVDTIYANGYIDDLVVKVKAGKTIQDFFAIKCMYACDNCGAILPPEKGQVLTVHLAK